MGNFLQQCCNFFLLIIGHFSINHISTEEKENFTNGHDTIETTLAMIKKETLNINKGVALTSTSDFFNELAKGNGPKNSILALGYAGWGPGQLEKEIIQNSWTPLSVESSFVFDDEVNNK